MPRKILCFLVFTFSLSAVHAQQSHKQAWVDSVFQSLNVSRKIGQLFMVPVSASMDDGDTKSIINQAKSGDIGGVIFTAGSPVTQARLINRLQKDADLPLLIAQDSEWDLGMGLDSVIIFPPALLLGAIRNDSLIYTLGKEVGRQMNLLGLHLSFAPVADTARHHANKILRYQLLGEEKTRIASKASAFTKGLKEENILTCAKFFTVKGITVTDVQKGWPSISPVLDSAKVYPFQKLFQQGLSGVMMAPEQFPLFYQNTNLSKKNEYNSSVLSSLFTGRWIKDQLNYQGLIFADVRNTKGIAEKLDPGEAELFVFQAGNDVMLYPADIDDAIRKIRRLVRKDENAEKQLDVSVRKILEAKYDAGLWKKQEVNTENLLAKIYTRDAVILNHKLEQAAVTVIQNKDNVLPIRSLENRRFAYLSTDVNAPSHEFYEHLQHYMGIDHFSIDAQTDFVNIINQLKEYEIIIVGVFPQASAAIIERLNRVLKELPEKAHPILCDFGNELFLSTASQQPTVVTSYLNTPDMLRIVPEVVFGGLKADGTVPLSGLTLRQGAGSVTEKINRLIYTLPEEAGMDSNTLSKIDSIASEAIKKIATPGCQVFIARNGKVVYDKSFGYQTYDKTSVVNEQTIYDLASLTKVSATLQAVMFMHEKGLIDINKKASIYLPELKKSNKKDMTLLEMLTHQAGLAPFIPLWPQTVKDTVFLPQYYSRTRSASYPFQVAAGLYTSPVMRDSIWSWIIQSKLIEKPPRTPYPYRYSDLGFMILQKVAERVLNQPLEDFLQQNFYEPLGAYTTGFNPLDRFSVQAIAPTEKDNIYRRRLVAGTVHDERAAMMGGVSGHAGLFSSANDLAKLAQMLAQEGYYGGYQYYKPETVRLFRSKQFDKSRRGLGWDKPIQSDWNSPTSLMASPETFGHTGFTGTCLWVDPEFNLVYIFLSNRVYPDRSAKLLSTNIRTRIQDVIYQSIFNYCGTAQ